MAHRTLLPISRRRMLGGLAATAWLQLPLDAHAGFNFFLSEYTASQQELQAQIAKQFPVERRYAEIFTVLLREPRLTLDARGNRAAISAIVVIGSPLLQPSAVGGIVSVSSALKYDAPALTLRLDQPRADRIELQGVGGRDAERLQQVGALVAQELLRDYPLHTFKREELTVGRKTYEIGAITVLNDGIKVELK